MTMVIALWPATWLNYQPQYQSAVKMTHTKSDQGWVRVEAGQIFLAISLANARNDSPPSSDRSWSPPNLPNYERELASQRFNNVEGVSRVSINSRKVYNLAELIDIAQRSNPETRVAWER